MMVSAMQLIEQSSFGVRSAVLTMTSPEGGPRFVLLPMIHLGTRRFYGAVVDELGKCDLVLMEGVQGRRTRLVTLAYRIAGRIHRQGLIDQSRGMNLTTLRSRLVTPDATAAEFATSWRQVSLRMRWIVYVLAPVLGIWLAIVGPRRALGQDVAVDDLPSRDDALAPDQIQALQSAITDDRDLLLCEALWAAAESELGVKAVAVCWGAGHMPAAVRFLRGQLGYRITHATWIEVF